MKKSRARANLVRGDASDDLTGWIKIAGKIDFEPCITDRIVRRRRRGADDERPSALENAVPVASLLLTEATMAKIPKTKRERPAEP